MRLPHAGMRNRRLTTAAYPLGSRLRANRYASPCRMCGPAAAFLQRNRIGMLRVGLSLAGAGMIFYLFAFQFSNMFA